MIRQIAARKLPGYYRDAMDDIVQKIGLNLWKWKTQKDERGSGQADFKAAGPADADFNAANSIQTGSVEESSLAGLSSEDWKKVANVAAHNEIKSFYSSKYQRQTSLSEQETDQERFQENNSGNLPGNTGAEVRSILVQLWKALQILSLRQKYAFLLQKEEFITDLIHHNCCKKQEIADFLHLDYAEFDTILSSLPLTDDEIQKLIEERPGSPNGQTGVDGAR